MFENFFGLWMNHLKQCRNWKFIIKYHRERKKCICALVITLNLQYIQYWEALVLGLINIIVIVIVTYTQVWYIIGIVSSSPTHFHSEKIGLIGVTIDPLSTVGLIWHSEGTYSEVWYIIGNVCSNPTHFCT